MAENETDPLAPTEVTVDDLPVRRSPVYRSFFANAINLVTSHMDVRMVFGEVGPDEKGEIAHEQVASVVMSWEHAKALAAILLKNVRDHEQRFGPLYLMPKAPQAEGSTPPAPKAPDAPKAAS
ncbi:MAG: hypothetical protein JWO19_4323 [Bryobacterales bacterium]|nr:hypothetical protein [Bryobacterales bacterium]